MKRIPSLAMRMGTTLVLVSLAIGSASLIAPYSIPITTQPGVAGQQDPRFLTTYTDRTISTREPGRLQTKVVATATALRNIPVVRASGTPESQRYDGFRDDEQVIVRRDAAARPTATPLVIASIDTAALTDTTTISNTAVVSNTAAVSETVAVAPTPEPPIPTPEPPIMTPEEIAVAEAAMRDGQARMSRARTQFRQVTIAAAEKEVANVTKALEKLRAEYVKQEEVTTAQEELQVAQADFERVRLENINLVDVEKAQAEVEAAEQRLQAAQSQKEADPTLVAIAQERILTAQQNYTTVAGEASARKTTAEQVMNEMNAIFIMAQDAYSTSAAQHEQAQQGIDPVSGMSFHDAGLDAVAQQQHYALAFAAANAHRDDAQTKLNAAVTVFEEAKAQEVADVAAAQAAIEQAQAELAQIPQEADPTAVAQAQQEVDTLRAQLEAARVQQASNAEVVVVAQQSVKDAEAKLNTLQEAWAAAAPVLAEAQQRIDEATANLKQVRQSVASTGIWSWPTYGTLTSGFGKRNLKVNTYHNGIDIANIKNTPIGAVRAGTVTEAGWCKGYGFCVRLSHGGGLTSEYGHMASAPPVKAGDIVEAGTMIGWMGTTYDESHGGYSTGVHLHMTIRYKGQAVDPLQYLP